MTKGKKALIISLATVLTAAIVIAVLFATHVICIHQWIPASCTEPKTCAICKKTEGAAQGHQWTDATCTEPKTCHICSLTEGSALGHSWNEATCTEAKRCAVCQATEGEPLGHSVGRFEVTKEPTCAQTGEKAADCSRCGEHFTEEMEKLLHTPGEWQVTQDYRINSDGSVEAGKEAVPCLVCGEEVESREYTIELTTSQKNAVIKAYDDIPFWHPSYDFMVYSLLMDYGGFNREDAKFAADHIDVDWDEQAILYAKEHVSGKSKSGLTEEMRHYKFTNEQIEAALKEVGY